MDKKTLKDMEHLVNPYHTRSLEVFHSLVNVMRWMLKENWQPEKATRKFLYTLFPYGYGQQACKIAGMRKPLKLMLDV